MNSGSKEKKFSYSLPEAEDLSLFSPAISSLDQKRLDQHYTKSSGLPLLLFMEQAAAAIFHFLRQRPEWEDNDSVLILCGPGMNGGDGWALARQLSVLSKNITVADFAAERSIGEVADQMRDAAHALAILNVQPKDLADWGKETRPKWIIDALLGTGFQLGRGLLPDMENLLPILNSWRNQGSILLSIDIPSGVSANTGQRAEGAIDADQTLTFVYPKRGLLLSPGGENAGNIQVLPIGQADPYYSEWKTRIIERSSIQTLLPKRSENSHKGSHGRVLLLAGSPQMPGALRLAMEASLRAGVGYLYAAVDQELLPMIGREFPEALHSPLNGNLNELFSKVDAIACGPGWGKAEGRAEILAKVLASDCPLILDADALNILAENKEGMEALRARANRLGANATVLTPHPGEFARLFPELAELLLNYPLEAATSAAKEASALILLKGSHSILALANGYTLIHPRSCSGLARAGSGDFLSGLILALVGQGLPMHEATALAIYLHVETAKRLSRVYGEAGMRIFDLAKVLPDVWTSLSENSVL